MGWVVPRKSLIISPHPIVQQNLTFRHDCVIEGVGWMVLGF